jgi:hypothetical protein
MKVNVGTRRKAERKWEVAMKDKQHSLAAAILSANLTLGANTLFAQNLPGPNVPKPRLELLQETEPAIWRAAQAVPGPEPLPWSTRNYS